MNDLRDVLEKTQSNGTAIGHFNISDWILLKAVFGSAYELKVPVIVGASEGERAFLGVAQLAATVRSLREKDGFPIFLNADHTHTLDSAIAAAKAGFDSVVYDLSALPFEENVKQTKQAVEALKSINPRILVEGEIGNIGTGSDIHESLPDRSLELSKPEEAMQFVESTGVDVLAPAVGNSHGMLQAMVQGDVRKHLDLSRIEAIKRASKSFLTLHGGSATEDSDLRSAIAAGINIIHINTELRVAWRKGLEEALALMPREIVPYKLLPFVEESVKQVVLARLRLFNQRQSASIAQ
ncbi:Fructose-bisphosphate aldolase class II [Acidisarcina polymorpha]|uniref:Fructose-bisphosphate aldolase class II n=1 Tax=Acidisarcina polymorpha TaxID=2211140 RepID=A0A2Z5G1C5_9BACT|nr:class II fructose-bisphosphate aldolase [Acidisarcina polymorpha]AXC12537.1 Fructose-bisphosphate aldolase class II [Acidisarcina polymorpha]